MKNHSGFLGKIAAGIRKRARSSVTCRWNSWSEWRPLVGKMCIRDSTQEYPERFVVGRAVIDGASAQVAVSLGEAASARVVHVFLRNVGGRWRMDDLRYDDGRTLRQLLQP